MSQTSGASNGTPTWDDRLREVQRLFPSTADPNWYEALANVELMGMLLRETLRVGATPKRRGSRPMLEAEEGMARLRQLFGDDYTTLPFPQAFRILAGDRSLTQVARRTGLSRSQVHRLFNGRSEATGREMEMVAQGYSKPAVYFVEYRVGVLLDAMSRHLLRAPETSVGLVRQLKLVEGS